MAYVNIPKPTGTPYTNLSHGLAVYDDPSIVYDDPNVFYDGVDSSSYVNVAKPTGESAMIRAGMATGLLMPLTYAVNYTIPNSQYVKVLKPT